MHKESREPHESEKDVLNIDLYTGVYILIYQGECYLQLVKADFCMMQVVYCYFTSTTARITDRKNVDDTG